MHLSHIYITRPLTFLAWYRHINEEWRVSTSSLGMSDCRLAQGTFQNKIEKLK
jgi:hypothetical protein